MIQFVSAQKRNLNHILCVRNKTIRLCVVRGAKRKLFYVHPVNVLSHKDMKLKKKKTPVTVLKSRWFLSRIHHSFYVNICVSMTIDSTLKQHKIDSNKKEYRIECLIISFFYDRNRLLCQKFYWKWVEDFVIDISRVMKSKITCKTQN